jgi:hypothetical protein
MLQQAALNYVKSNLTGKFYIVVRNPTPDDDDVYGMFFTVGEFDVEQPGQFENELIAALHDYQDEIYGCIDDLSKFDPARDIYIVPQAYWISLEDLKYDPVSVFYEDEFDDENEEGESDEDENVDKQRSKRTK